MSPEWSVKGTSSNLNHALDTLMQMPHPIAFIVLLSSSPETNRPVLSQLYHHLYPTFGDDLTHTTDAKLYYQLTTKRERSVIELQPSEFAASSQLTDRLLKNGAKRVILIGITAKENPTKLPTDCQIIAHG